MSNEVNYRVRNIADVAAHLLADVTVPDGKDYCIIRKGRIEKVWSFHNTVANAEAAARRWRSREYGNPR